MRKSVAILLLTTTCLLPSATFAFDGKREGLILGVGVGVANMSYTRTETNTTGIRTDSHFEGERMGFDADFKIGLGFNEDVMFLWYLGYSDFSDIESIRGGLFGMRVYRPFEMLFFALSFEMATLDDEGSTQSHDGWGLRGGVGWEFTKHWSVEAGVSPSVPIIVRQILNVNRRAVGGDRDGRFSAQASRC